MPEFYEEWVPDECDECDEELDDDEGVEYGNNLYCDECYDLVLIEEDIIEDYDDNDRYYHDPDYPDW